MKPMDELSQIKLKFSQISSWEEKYNYLIELGKSLPPLSDSLKTEDLKIKGCQSQVWLKADLDSEGRIIFQADSDALIVKGLVALLVALYSKRTPDEILNCEPTVIKEIGLDTHLTPSRANGLAAMIRQMKFYALAYKAQGKS